MPGAPVYCDYDAGSAVPLRETVYVSKTPGPTTNAVEVVPAWGGILHAGDTIQVWHPTSPTRMQSRGLYQPRPYPITATAGAHATITLLLDGNMQKPV